MTGITSCTLAVNSSSIAARRSLPRRDLSQPAHRRRKEKRPCSSAARNTMHLWRYIRVVLWLIAHVGTCDLLPRGWTEDGAVGPAQFVYIFPADRTASSKPSPSPNNNNSDSRLCVPQKHSGVWIPPSSMIDRAVAVHPRRLVCLAPHVAAGVSSRADRCSPAILLCISSPSLLSRRGSGAGSSAEPIPFPHRDRRLVTKQHKKGPAKYRQKKKNSLLVLLSSQLFF